MGGGKLLSFNALFVTFRMPLFFFISGFILYKNDFEWTLPVSGKFLLKKAKVQLIPTFFFLAVYTYIFDISFTNSLFWPDKSGYWFTIALFEFFLSYVLLRIICNKLGYKNGVDWLILAAAVIIYFVRRWYLTSGLYEEPMFLLVGMENLSYFLFFVIGTLARKHYDKIQKFAENGYIVAACLLFFFGVIIYKLHESQEMSSVLSILYLLSRIVGVILVFIFFMKNENLFTQETRLGRALQYVGRRTLDIYLLHYFFLPRNLEPIANFFNTYQNPSLELFVSLLISILVICLCLLMSKIIRLSPVLADWLLGVKKKA